MRRTAVALAPACVRSRGEKAFRTDRRQTGSHSVTSCLPVVHQEPVFGFGPRQGHRASWPLGDEKTRENSNLLEIEMSNIITKAVSTPDDIVEQVAAKSDQARVMSKRRETYNLNQKDSKDRGPAVSSERGDRLLQHHLYPQQTDRIWNRGCNPQ